MCFSTYVGRCVLCFSPSFEDEWGASALSTCVSCPLGISQAVSTPHQSRRRYHRRYRHHHHHHDDHPFPSVVEVHHFRDGWWWYLPGFGANSVWYTRSLQAVFVLRLLRAFAPPHPCTGHLVLAPGLGSWGARQGRRGSPLQRHLHFLLLCSLSGLCPHITLLQRL